MANDENDGVATSTAKQPPQSPEKQPPQPPKEQPKRVEVLVENLGYKLLKKGTVTSDPEIVALLKTARGRKLVREVK